MFWNPYLLLTVYAGVCSGAPGPSVRGPTTVQAYPSLVQIERFDPYGSYWVFMCAGNILTTNTVLSAAHCFHIDYDDYYYPEFRQIRAGATYRNRNGVINNVANVLNHPYFHNNVDNVYGDISIVRLRDQFSFGNTINYISIIPENWEIPDNSPVVQAGWGWNPLDSESDVLRDVTIYTVNREICIERNGIIAEDSICAGILDAGLEEGCPGDYGGPLYFGGVLAGVFSWGGCEDPNYPGVSTKISDYTDWIVANAN